MTEAASTTIPPPRGTYRRKRRKDGEAQAPQICFYCKNKKPVHFWKSDTKPVCITCYQKHIKIEPCSKCGNKRTVRQRDESGGALCHTCYQKDRPKEICVACGDLGKIVKRLDDGGGKCSRCYQRERRERLKACSNHPQPS